MASKQTLSLKGQFTYVIFSPKGEIEGALLGFENGLAQLVFDRHDDEAGAAFTALRQGQIIVVEAQRADVSDKGVAEHPVFTFVKLAEVDGVAPPKPKSSKDADYEGTVVRLNYARHGEANGVVLDSGDFIHLKPEGMKKLKLKIGDKVSADGDAHLLATGRGWAVEATSVNGKKVKSK
jgi:hypothetical protein